MTLAQISHTTLSLIKSLVFAIGWTGRCCLYPLVSRGNCRWLGTVSFTTNSCCLRPKAPNRHRCFRIFECTPVAFIAGRFLPFLFTRVLCSLWKYHRAPTIASALRLEGMNCLAAEPPLHLHLARQCTHGRLCRASIQLANAFISRACGTQFLGEMRAACTDWLAWTEGYAQSRCRWPHLPSTGRKEHEGRTCLAVVHPILLDPVLPYGIFVCYFWWTGRCCLYPLVSWGMLLAGNCLPYHQPEFLATKDTSVFLITTASFPPYQGVVPTQHSSDFRVEPYCGLTVHVAEGFAPEQHC